MTDEPFFRRPGEATADWHARLRSMDPHSLSCLQRQRKKIWLEMARDALRKERKAGKSRRSSAAEQAGHAAE